jgi:hypothetical protein
VNKRQDAAVEGGGRNAVLSRREQVGPNLIHGGTQAGQELRRVPGIRYGSWSRFLCPFNFGQTRLRGFVKLARQTSNRGVGKQAEEDHVTVLLSGRDLVQIFRMGSRDSDRSECDARPIPDTLYLYTQ